MKKISKILLLSLLTFSMAIGCGDRKPKSSSDNTPSSIAPATSLYDSSVAPISSSDDKPISSSEGPVSSSEKDSSSNMPSSSSAVPSSSKEGSSSSEKPSSSAAPSSSSQAPSSSSQAPSSSSQAPSSSVAPTLVSISLNTDNVKKTYTVGENLDLTGLVVTANYSDNSSNAVTDYTTNPATGTVLNSATTVNVVVTYQSRSADFNVTVNEPPKVLTGITLDVDNVKIDYVEGDNLDLTGLVVTANFNDGSSEPVTNYTTNPANGAVLDTVGDQFVTVTYEDFNEQFLINVAPGTKMDWTDAEKAIMEEHLYDYYFPYNGLEESVVEYDSYYDMVVISGGEVTIDEIGDYVALLVEEGFEVIGSNDVAYGVEAAIETDEGKRTIYAYVGVESDEFYLEAYDPYMYEFPQDLIDDYFLSYGDYTVEIPAIEGDYYYFSEDEDNELYYYYEMYEYINAELDVYGIDSDPTDDYIEALELEGWTITGEGSASLIIENLGVAKIEFGYSEGYGVFYIVIYWQLDPIPSAEWPAAEIAEFLGEEITDEVPEFEGDATGYTVLNDSYGFAIMVGVEPGTETAAVESYAATLKRELYTEYGEDAYGDMQYISPNEQILVTPYFGTDGSITISIAKPAQWPAEDVAALLAANGVTKDTIPPFLGGTNYEIDDDYSYADAAIIVSVGDPAAAAEAYYDVLEEEEWVDSGLDSYSQQTYTSPNGEILISFWIRSSYGLVQMELTFIEPVNWPAEDVAAAVADLDSNITTVVPASLGASAYQVNANNPQKVQIVCVYGSSTNVQNAYDAYLDALEDALFGEGEMDADGNMHYDSENGDMNICPWIYSTSNYLVIEVFAGVSKPVTSGWPLEDIATFLDGDLDLARELPVYDDSLIYTVTTSSYADFIIKTEVEDSAAKTAAKEAYTDILKEAGWTENGTDSYGDMHYLSPSGLLDVNPTDGYSGNIFVIEVNLYVPPVFVEWSAADVLAYLKTYFGDETTDVLPAFNGATSITLSDQYAYAKIICQTPDNAQACADYQAILKAAGFSEMGEDEYGDMHYGSPSKQYDVCPWYNSTYFIIDIEVYVEPEVI